MGDESSPNTTNAEMRRSRRLQALTNVTRVSLNDTSFDDAFWRSVPASDRMSYTWETFLEGCRWRGIDGSKLRLQRSVARLFRRRFKDDAPINFAL
jgi:hypothetical protein